MCVEEAWSASSRKTIWFRFYINLLVQQSGPFVCEWICDVIVEKNGTVNNLESLQSGRGWCVEEACSGSCGKQFDLDFFSISFFNLA